MKQLRKSILEFSTPLSVKEERNLLRSREVFQDSRKVEISTDRKTVTIYEPNKQTPLSE